MRWEYKEIEYDHFPSVKELNIEGESGWELVFIRNLARGDSSNLMFFWNTLFKRSIKTRANIGPK